MGTENKISTEDQDLAGLTDAERAALEDDDANTDGDADSDDGADKPDADSGSPDGDGNADSKDDDSSDSGADDDADDDADASKDAGDADKGEDADADDKDKDADDKNDSDADRKPERDHKLVSDDLPEDHAQQLKDIDGKLDALYEKHDLGDLSYQEMKQAERSILDDRHELIRVRDEAAFTEKQNANAWDVDVEKFFANNTGLNNSIMKSAMSGALNDLYKSHPGASNSYYLGEAAKQVLAAFGKTEDAPTVDKAPKKATKKGALEGTKLPKTLSGLPESHADKESGDENDALDNLQGLELEAAIDRMSKPQQEKYLRSVS